MNGNGVSLTLRHAASLTAFLGIAVVLSLAAPAALAQDKVAQHDDWCDRNHDSDRDAWDIVSRITMTTDERIDSGGPGRGTTSRGR